MPISVILTIHSVISMYVFSAYSYREFYVRMYYPTYLVLDLLVVLILHVPGFADCTPVVTRSATDSAAEQGGETSGGRDGKRGRS